MEISNISRTKITAVVRCGAEITNCIEEAIVMALELNTPVEITHNQQIYTANPSDLVRLVSDSGTKVDS